MDEKGFRQWWRGSPTTLQTYLSLLKSIIGPNGSGIDEYFNQDECQSLIDMLSLEIEYEPDTKRRKKLKDSRSAVRAYVRFKKGLSHIVKAKRINVSTRTKRITKKSKGKALNKLLRGYDKDGNYVWYQQKVKPDNRIPGLVELVESKYRQTIDFIFSLFEPIERKYIPIILSPDTPYRVYENDDDTIAKKIKVNVDNNKGNITEKEILKWLKPIVLRTYGEYHPDGDECYLEGPHIVIYYNNFDTTDREAFRSKIGMVVAHEYMHYYHHMYIGTSKFMDGSEKADKVKEAVADFFAFLFLVKTKDNYNSNEKVAIDRYNFWGEYFGTVVPYAATLWFFYVDGAWVNFTTDYNALFNAECIYKFSEVIIESECTNLQGAYDNELIK